MIRGIQFILELTNKCNFKCKYCYLEQAEAISHNIHHIMAEETGIRILQYIYNNFYDRYENIFIDFLDGEPLINFDIMNRMIIFGEDLEKGNSKFIYRFTTNGSLLTEDIVNFAIEHKIYFNVSVDGLPETHDENRVFHNGKGTSSIVYDKLQLVAGLNNVGIVSTYSAKTYKKMQQGTQRLMELGFKHIEVNFCMGKVDHYDIDDLEIEYNKVIKMYLERYQRGDFSCTYVILDQILRGLFCNNRTACNCIHPYKVTYDGQVKSCDRIPLEYNNVITTVYDQEFNYFDLKNCHYCSDNEVQTCKECGIRHLCTPCNIYMNDMFNVQESSLDEPIFCIVMKCLITNAMEFYEKNKRNLLVTMHFNDAIRNSIINGHYEVK